MAETPIPVRLLAENAEELFGLQSWVVDGILRGSPDMTVTDAQARLASALGAPVGASGPSNPVTVWQQASQKDQPGGYAGLDTDGNPQPERVEVDAASGAAYTVDLANGLMHDVTLTAAEVAITLPAPVAGRQFVLVVRQDGQGGREATWSACKWPGQAPPQLTPTANGVDALSFICANVAEGWIGFPVYDLR